QLVARAEADAAFRAAVLADLERALQAEGVEPQPRVVNELRRLLADKWRGVIAAHYDPPVAQEPADLPAWSLPAGAGERISIGVEWPERVTREWAFGGATGKGMRVCILDSGIEPGHPRVGEVERAVAFARGEGEDEEVEVVEDTAGDLCGHGTACAGIVRQLAPEGSLVSE